MQAKTERTCKMLLLIDNYDSFTYNLYHYLGEQGGEVQVVRNDAVSVEEALALSPQAIILSPGPKTPSDAGICVSLVQAAAERAVPMFGVCLGLQSIAQAYGGKIIRHNQLYHGKTSEIRHDNHAMFADVPSPFVATRYHSLIVEAASLPSELEVTATTDSGVIMGLKHKSLPLYGVQFHPESIATEHGKKILSNFLGVL